MKASGGALPVSMVKFWGELMGLAGGSVRSPLSELSTDEKAQLRSELKQLRTLKPITRNSDPIRETMINSRNGSSSEFTSGMMLMVSVQNLAEAMEADRGGADVVDVKNLQEALVGSAHPSIVQAVRTRIPAAKHVSVTLGVVPSQPGTVAMAAYAAGALNATSVKVGFCKADYDTAVEILRESRKALKGFQSKLIGSLFADNSLFNGLDPHCMVQLAKDGLCDGFLIDTLTKDGRNLFDFMTEKELRDMVIQGKELGMSTALSGHLRLDNLDELARINPDIVGVRGAACSKGERDRTVAWEAVSEFKRALEQRKSGELSVFTDAAKEINNSNHSGWAVIDGRGKNCAGVIAALSGQMERDHHSIVEAILADALNIYDVLLWAEQAGHKLLSQRKEADGTLRVLIQPQQNTL
jgi:uncharacterized protein (UPF0264 family)/TusA-related sulfurtransferase